MYEAALSWIEAHPRTFAVLCTVLVPVLLSAFSFVDGWAAKRWPVAVAFARALLPDLKRALAIAASGALESRKLPVPPEVRQLTVERVEKAIEGAASLRTPVRPPPLPLLLVVALLGCTADLEPAKSAANATRDIGIAGAELLERFCTVPFRQAQTREEVDAIRGRGCREAANAYDALRTAHTTLHAVIAATEAGQCVGVSRSSRECNVAGAYVELAKAASQWATAIARLQDGAS